MIYCFSKHNTWTTGCWAYSLLEEHPYSALRHRCHPLHRFAACVSWEQAVGVSWKSVPIPNTAGHSSMVTAHSDKPLQTRNHISIIIVYSYKLKESILFMLWIDDIDVLSNDTFITFWGNLSLVLFPRG